jgi:acetoacetate decarboxylase
MSQGKLCRMFEPDWMLCAGGGGDRIDTNYIVLTATGDLEYLKQLVPAPLEASDQVVIYQGFYKKTIIDGKVAWNWPFQEWGFGIKSKLTQAPYAEGLFLVQLYVDDDLVFAHGREIWGYPKKMADMKISPDTDRDSDRFDYTVTRRGSRLVTASVSNLRPINSAEFPLQTGHVICFKQIPSATSPMIKSQELVFVRIEFPQGDAWGGDASIEITDGIADQLPFGPLKDLKGYFGRRLFTHHGLSDLVVDAMELARPLKFAEEKMAAAEYKKEKAGAEYKKEEAVAV